MRLQISAGKVAIEVREMFFSCCYRQRVPKSKLILIWLALSIQANKSFTFLSTDFIFLGVLWLPFAFLLYLDKFPFVSRNW